MRDMAMSDQEQLPVRLIQLVKSPKITRKTPFEYELTAFPLQGSLKYGENTNISKSLRGAESGLGKSAIQFPPLSDLFDSLKLHLG